MISEDGCYEELIRSVICLGGGYQTYPVVDSQAFGGCVPPVQAKRSFFHVLVRDAVSLGSTDTCRERPIITKVDRYGEAHDENLFTVSGNSKIRIVGATCP